MFEKKRFCTCDITLPKISVSSFKLANEMYMSAFPPCTKFSRERKKKKLIGFCEYLGIRALEATLVPKASSLHKSRVSFPAHRAHSLCTFVEELETAEIVAQFVPDNRGQNHDITLSSVETSCSSN